MAEYIPNPVGFISGLVKKTPDEISAELADTAEHITDAMTSPARLSIIASRAIGAARGQFISRRNVRKTLKSKIDPFTKYEWPELSEERKEFVKAHKSGQSFTSEKARLNQVSFQETPFDIAKKRISNPVVIMNLDAGENKGDEKVETLVLHSVPKELKYDASSNFVGLASIGRNNPHYNYAGSEDTLSFSIDWYCKGNDRAEVLRNCRWVEALSKSNGYAQRPPRVKISWGLKDYLFGDDEWIVVEAGYSLSNFQSGYQPTDNKFRPIDAEPHVIGGLPQQAYQNITLKRIANVNRTWKEIKNISNLPGNTLIHGTPTGRNENLEGLIA